jgi:chromosome segregation ATPase
VLEVARACVKDQKKNSKVVQALFHGQKKGVLRGVKGRLGNLGCIMKEYDIAISTS